MDGKMKNNLIIKHASQLVTCSGYGARTGNEMSDLHVIEDGAVVVENGMITAVGKTGDLLPGFDKKGFDEINATDKAVLPGFVDSHTHFVFGGYREKEFSWRLKGDSYMEIMSRGGGIASTVKATADASKKMLFDAAKDRLDQMLAFGVTTVEGKSGYGLDRDTEIRQLEVMADLHARHPMDIVPTFLGAHAVPAPYKDDPDQYIDFIINDVLPVVCEKKLAEFCDIFCEKNVFSIEQSKRLLTHAKNRGLKLKLHADEIVQLGGAELAARLGATSADHLLQASDEGIRLMAQNNVVATLLPATAFCLREPYARAKQMIRSGCAVALATDMNPGSSFTHAIPLIFALATLYMDMSVEQAITAMTLNGAAALDRADVIGSIDPGKQADLVILKYPSFRFLAYHTGVNIVEKVIKKGRLVIDR